MRTRRKKKAPRTARTHSGADLNIDRNNKREDRATQQRCEEVGRCGGGICSEVKIKEKSTTRKELHHCCEADREKQ